MTTKIILFISSWANKRFSHDIIISPEWFFVKYKKNPLKKRFLCKIFIVKKLNYNSFWMVLRWLPNYNNFLYLKYILIHHDLVPYSERKVLLVIILFHHNSLQVQRDIHGYFWKRNLLHFITFYTQRHPIMGSNILFHW